MPWCCDPYEPECEGESCKEWGKCGYSKQVIEDEGVEEEEENQDGCHNQGRPDGSA